MVSKKTKITNEIYNDLFNLTEEQLKKIRKDVKK